MFVRNTLRCKDRHELKEKDGKKIFYAKITAYTKIKFKRKKLLETIKDIL